MKKVFYLLSGLVVAFGLAAFITVPKTNAAKLAATQLVSGTTVASWSFNQPPQAFLQGCKINCSTTVTDQTGNGHTGVLSNQIVWDHQLNGGAGGLVKLNSFQYAYDQCTQVPGTPGKLVCTHDGYFPDNHGVFNIAPSAQMSPGTRDFAFGASVNTTDLWNNIFQAGTTQVGQDFIKFEMAHSGTLGGGFPRCHFTGSLNDVLLLGNKSITDGKWHAVRCDKTASSIMMQVDGVVVNQRNIAIGTVDVANETWSIGGKYMPNAATTPTGSPQFSQSDTFQGYLKNVFLIIGN